MGETVVIVGGGFSGVSMIYHLLQKGHTKKNIHMFEAAETAGPGLAWSPTNTDDCQLCNLPIGLLSIAPDFKPTFLEWLKETPTTTTWKGKDTAALPWTFPPRRLFGEYLQEMAAKLGRENDNVFIHTKTEVTAVQPTGATFKVSSVKTVREVVAGAHGSGSGGGSGSFSSSFTAHKVILCTGSPGGSGGNFAMPDIKSSRYISSPWPFTTLANFDNPKKIGIVGTGLTAIDVIKYLHKKYPQATLVAGSRQGRFNVVAMDLSREKVGKQGLYVPKVLTEECVESLKSKECVTLEELTELVRQELVECMKETKHTEQDLRWDYITGDSVDGIVELREHVRNHEDGKLFRFLFCMWKIDEVVHTLWQKLNTEEKQKWFSSPLKTVYQNHSNPFPVESAWELLEMEKQGKLIVKSRLKTITPTTENNDNFTFEFNTPSTATDDNKHEPITDIEYVVNCTGVVFDITKSESRLMQQMLADKLCVADPFGGIVLENDTLKVRNGDGEVVNIWAVGHLAKGNRYLTSGLGFLKAMISTVVESIPC